MDAREQITYWTTLPSVELADMDAVLQRFSIDGAQTISDHVAKLAAADVLDRVAMAMALVGLACFLILVIEFSD